MAFDIMKLILSVFVVGIHAEIFPTILNPLFRMAVPLFFMMSGYFFFRKDPGLKDIKKFIKRNLSLYILWFIILFPVTAWLRSWFNKPVYSVIKEMFIRFWFNSTFRASWYIMALTIGVVIIYLLSKRVNQRAMTIICFSSYLICCLCSNYFWLLEKNGYLLNIYHNYVDVFYSVVNSWPASLWWIYLGKRFAESNRIYNKRILLIFAVSSFVLLYIEQGLLIVRGSTGNKDCYLLLIPLCVTVFLLVKDSKVYCKYSKFFRKLSTVMYVTHASVISLLGFVCYKRGCYYPTLNFILALIVGYIICILIGYLEKKTNWKWLQYLY